jgi:hypothetical protein
MFQAELAYFIAHQDELVRQHRGKVLVLQGQQVVGVYANLLTAYLEAQKTYKLGTFMLQRCEPGPEAYTITISTPSVFYGMTQHLGQ